MDAPRGCDSSWTWYAGGNLAGQFKTNVRLTEPVLYAPRPVGEKPVGRKGVGYSASPRGCRFQQLGRLREQLSCPRPVWSKDGGQ